MSPLRVSRLRRSRLVDRLAAALITVGGSTVLLAVAFLMVFLVAQCLPLLRRGVARPVGVTASGGPPLVAVADDYGENLVAIGADGAARVVSRSGTVAVRRLEGVKPPVREACADPSGTLVALVDAAAEVQVWACRTDVSWHGSTRVVEPSLRRVAGATLPTGARLLAVAGEVDAPQVLVANGDGATLLALGAEPPVTNELLLQAQPLAGAVSRDGREVWLASAHELAWFFLDRPEGGPAAPRATEPLAAMPTVLALLLGDTTCLVGDAAGGVAGWQVVSGPVAGSRVLDLAARFSGNGAVLGLAVSPRDKAFAVVRRDRAEIDYLASRQRLLTIPRYPADAALAGFYPRRDGFFAIGVDGRIHRWALDLGFPEVTAGTLFLPVRYEGYTAPTFVWQSTGGSESFEPKLSLIPLLVGTLKGAFYALLFSAPAALAAALYLSQFAGARARAIAKPVVEMMAALPSVVVGFLAALLLAPLLQRHLVGTLALLILLPLSLVLAAGLWEMTPRTWRRRTGPARELALVAILLALVTFASYAAEGVLDRDLFGGDFPRWLLAATGASFDQRNALVVGFALGFAVIPIIFTLAEDAFSNVPPSLISASLALGATRWQAARTVAIPAASPGLFAAVMTGFGRAVGETMIVLMATGNTPILSLSPFSGMRTMSACIAVELPEAPFGGALYRVLILTALLLFAMTFVINTVAVMVGWRLRRRFGRLAA